MGDIEVLKVGLQYSRRSLSCLYRLKGSSSLRAHRIPVQLPAAADSVDDEQSAEAVAADIMARHSRYLNERVISRKQLTALVQRLIDHVPPPRKSGSPVSTGATGTGSTQAGASGAGSGSTASATRHLAEIGDLNRVSEDELRRRKAEMELEFERNRKRPGDEGFQYDVQVDFHPTEKSEWDDDDE